MNFTALHQVAFDALHAPSVRRAANEASAVPVDVKSLEQQLRKVQGLTTPGFMSLHAVRRGPDVIDFEWDSADASAARLLCGGAEGLVGRRLVEFMANRPGRAEVFAHYRRVVDFGAAKAVRHWGAIGASPAILHHAAVHLYDGVAVILTNLSAVRREIALRHEIEARVSMRASDRNRASA